MSPEESSEGLGKIQRFPTADVLLRNIDETLKSAVTFIAEQEEHVADYEKVAIESEKREIIDDAANQRQALRDLEERVREVAEAGAELKKIKAEGNGNGLAGLLKGVMASYKELQKAFKHAEDLITPPNTLIDAPPDDK